MKQVFTSFMLLIIAILAILLLARVDQFYEGAIDDIWLIVLGIAFITAGVILFKRLIRKRATIVLQRPSLINYEQLEKAGISNCEAEILVLIDEGLTNQQIANKLLLTESTVRRHTSTMCKKFKVKYPNESVKRAKELCILL